MAARPSRAGPRPPLTLDTDAAFLKGAGPVVALRLRTLGIERVRDLLFHLPLRYEDRRRHALIAQARVGEDLLVLGRIVGQNLRNAGRRSLRVMIDDGSRPLLLRFFHFNEVQRSALTEGRWLQAFGSLRAVNGELEMVHPQYRVADRAEELPPERSLTPVYPLCAGLTQARLRQLIMQALELAARDAALARAMPGLEGPATLAALQLIHLPPGDADAQALLAGTHAAQRRLKCEELLAHQLGLRLLRARQRSRPAMQLAASAAAVKELEGVIGFAPTGAQRRVLTEVAHDLAAAQPMLRLVQGDVGSGKTVIAAMAMLAAARAGLQAALLAPTELLAEQLRGNLARWFEPLGLAPALLSNRIRKAQRSAVLAGLADGSLPLVVGTHAVFQDKVHFHALAVVVVDEQHRFGVQQRLALRDKGGARAPHQLILSATPIPRTLAQTVYADLDISVIDELPPGRTPVQTVVLSNERRDEVLQRIGEACRQQRQAYWVCTLIDASEELDAEAAEVTAARLRTELSGLRIGLVHGRMKAELKDQQMRAFRDGLSQVLVATTVIEVGVDVPNASIMVIENAERLGLSQLHQLRGRVGRGSTASQCLLFYQPPLGEAARARLETIRSSSDGFAIAQRDLELRGPGELLGRRQTGEIGMKLADPLRDAALIPPLQRLADAYLREQPELARLLIERWVGDPERYAHV